MRLFFIVAALFLAAAPERSMADMPMFSARAGIAIGGYDTVAYFQSGQAVIGKPRYAVIWKGAVWRFSSKSNQVRFEMNPRAYAPSFGGYCAYAMSLGVLEAGNPELWAIIDGKLFLLHDAQVRDLWQAQRVQRIAQARSRWPAVLKN